jgi:hypothetical protein
MTLTIMKPKIAMAARVWNNVTLTMRFDMSYSFLPVQTAVAETAIAASIIAVTINMESMFPEFKKNLCEMAPGLKLARIWRR